MRVARKLSKAVFRKKTRKFAAEGIKLVEEAYKAGKNPECLFCVDNTLPMLEMVADFIENAGTPVYRVTDTIMNKISSNATPPGIIGIIDFVDIDCMKILESNEMAMVFLDGVRDPGNLGAIIRVADACGCGGLILGRGCVDVYNEKVIRATAGSIFNIPISICDSRCEEFLTAARDSGVRIIGTDATGGKSYEQAVYTPPYIIVMGNEAWGISPEVRSICEDLITVPIYGKAESLNVAVAAGIVLYHARRS